MKRVMFVTSHFCSGSNVLFDSLSHHPRIEGYRTDSSYESCYDLLKLTGLKHKLNNSSAIYMDELLVNHSLASKSIYHKCNFVFVVRKPRPTLNEIVETKGYTFSSALSHYVFRLRRMRSIAFRSGGVFLTADNLDRGLGSELISDMLSLKEPIKIKKPIWQPVEDAISQRVLVEAEKSYDYTERFMKLYCSSV